MTMQRYLAGLLCATALCCSPARAQIFNPTDSTGIITACGTSDTQVLFTSGTSCAGSANFTWASPVLTLGVATSTTGQLKLTGGTSGTITITGQAAAGTFNFNLPITAGGAGTVLTSQAGGATAMTWTTLAASATTDTTNASNISSGTLPAARLPNPSATTLGGIESYAAVSNQWINAISTAGVPSSTQPACGNLSNAAASCSTDATNASNIGSGSLAVARETAGGADTQVQLNSSNAFAGSANLTWVSPALTIGVATSTTGKLKLTGATSGTITITGQGAAGTYEFDLPITAGSSGNFLTSQGGAGTAMTWTAAPVSATAANIGAACGSDTQVVFVDSTSCAGSAGLVYAKGNAGTTAQLTIGGNAKMLGEAADVIAHRNGTTAQTFRLYNTFTDASNYERASIDWVSTANALTIAADAAGTGTLRPIWFKVSGINIFQVGTNGYLQWNLDNTWGIGLPGARPIGIQVGTHLESGNGLAAPALSSCGTGATAAGTGSTDTGGFFTTGTGAPTACTLTFTVAYSNNSWCTISPANAAAGTNWASTFISTATKTAFTITTAAISSQKFNYTCAGS